MSFGDPSTMKNSNVSQFNPQQIPPLPDAFEDSFNISSLTAGEHRIYGYLHTHGWSEEKCSIYFRNVRAMQETLIHLFRAKGWTDDQVKAFNDTCDSELPEKLSTWPGENASDYEWQIFLLEEMNRRKRIGEKIGLPTLHPKTQDRDETRP